MPDNQHNQVNLNARPTEVGAPAFLWALVGLMALIELPLTLSDAGWIGSNEWRMNVFLLGAFWPPLVSDGIIPLYTGQKVLMFLTHAFLHGNFAHFAMNSVVLLALGKGISSVYGASKTIILLALSAIVGAATFWLLTSSSGPMIGASGAVFGLLGLWQARDYRQRRALGQSLQPVMSGIAGLIAINLVLYFALNGGIAWEAHLGGWLVGWISAWTLASRSAK
ncbi:rhomboid family intramembrane serine protease [Falsihalocynthiibacter sp. SS001]|uniref:rhomboid family intramembrane serine protease n=1 Tax=Falsihalocynthiibacter sp. SS001 TaxID=3349698 RepID=UPI0036D425CE